MSLSETGTGVARVGAAGAAAASTRKCELCKRNSGAVGKAVSAWDSIRAREAGSRSRKGPGQGKGPRTLTHPGKPLQSAASLAASLLAPAHSPLLAAVCRVLPGRPAVPGRNLKPTLPEARRCRTKGFKAANRASRRRPSNIAARATWS